MYVSIYRYYSQNQYIHCESVFKLLSNKKYRTRARTRTLRHSRWQEILRENSIDRKYYSGDSNS